MSSLKDKAGTYPYIVRSYYIDHTQESWSPLLTTYCRSLEDANKNIKDRYNEFQKGMDEHLTSPGDDDYTVAYYLTGLLAMVTFRIENNPRYVAVKDIKLNP